ncbi:glyceraldehyde-3-phosphate dehydrogenase 1 [Physocladia obscura]|uniref:Glyceraldehyde-3-phosphate dehydrogenase 1 n=1 Tax=Physocladia obscura TaxID=109957 RepID=A0AAD5XFZ7_9FUNG|nr:glyceraldehyde-3-phosphate dehydrogenase 1 [Physocladia obscura]
MSGQDADAANDPDHVPSRATQEAFAALVALIQSNPQYLANLCHSLSLSEIDPLLESLMISIFADNFDSRQEHLLLSVLEAELTKHFASADTSGNFLRANTPASRMLYMYCRRTQGRKYLNTTLTNLISSIVDGGDLDLEINPVKLGYNIYDDANSNNSGSHGLASNEEADESESNNGSFSIRSRASSANSRLGSLTYRRNSVQSVRTEELAVRDKKRQDLLDGRIKAIADIVRSFLDSIIASIDEVPYGIRWICKNIRNLAKEKLPGSSEAAIASQIGGFFMLRFLNPAIVSPEEFLAIKEKPSDTTKRTLTLVAKVLQSLANNKVSSSKETYMAPFFPFIEAHKARAAKFFTDLCEVEDFTDLLEVEQHLKKLQIDAEEVKIKVKELFYLHTLLAGRLDVVAPNESDPLRKIVKAISESVDHEQLAIDKQNQKSRIIILTLPHTQVDNDEQDNDKLYFHSTSTLDSENATNIDGNSNHSSIDDTTYQHYNRAQRAFSKILNTLEFERTDILITDIDESSLSVSGRGDTVIANLDALIGLAISSSNDLLAQNGYIARDALIVLKASSTSTATTLTESPAAGKTSTAGRDLIKRLSEQVAMEFFVLERVLYQYEQDYTNLKAVLRQEQLQEAELRGKYSELERAARESVESERLQQQHLQRQQSTSTSVPKPSVWSLLNLMRIGSHSRASDKDLSHTKS